MYELLFGRLRWSLSVLAYFAYFAADDLLLLLLLLNSARSIPPGSMLLAESFDQARAD